MWRVSHCTPVLRGDDDAVLAFRAFRKFKYAQSPSLPATALKPCFGSRSRLSRM